MRIWIGHHDRTGITIYDPINQTGVDQSHVRLWMVNDQELKLFHKDAVRPHLVPLERHLVKSGLASLIYQHGIVRQVAKRYLVSRPTHVGSPVAHTEESDVLDEGVVLQDYDDDERRLLNEELSENQDAWARSEEEGWFYEE